MIGISFSNLAHTPCPVASYARLWSWKISSWIQRSIRGERAFLNLLRKIKNRRMTRSMKVKVRDKVSVNARAKTLMLLREGESSSVDRNT